MSWRAVLLSLLAVAAPVWVLWPGCGEGEERHGTAKVDAGDALSGDGLDARGEEEAGDMLADAPAGETGPPYPGAEPCTWPGWYRMPALPEGCRTICIPDDIKKRVPPLVWVVRDDWCPGCKWLAGSSWPDGYGETRQVDQGIRALGAKPELVDMSFQITDQNRAQIMYDAEGQPIQASRADIHALSCWWGMFPTGEDNDTVGARFDALNQPLRWFFRPKDRAGELMLAVEPDFVYGPEFTQGANSGTFTAKWLIDEFYSFLSLVNLETKQATKIESLPGAPPGEYDARVIVGDTVFFERFWNKKSDWWVIPDAKNPAIKPFLGAADVAINQFAAGSQWIVWNEGTDFKPDGGPNFVEPQTYNLYRAPFTTDGAKLQRELLVANTEMFYGATVFANGYFVGLYLTQVAPAKSALLVVEVATGKAWHSTLSGNYYWGRGSYPTPTELWGMIMPNYYWVGGASEIVRVPYSAMQQVQNGLP